MSTRLYIFIVFVLQKVMVQCHVPLHASTPSNKIEQYCVLAESCIHDTIPICGKMGEEKRTFLDICDLLEYACDFNQIYTHVDEEENCPDKAK